MAEADLPTPETLRKLLNYDPQTGLLTWRWRESDSFAGVKDPERICRSWNSQFAGKPALTTIITGGYAGGTVCQRKVRAQRVAWAISYGKWPDNVIDHIDGDPLNNRLSNLRDVPQAVNAKNMSRSKANTSGHTGVSWDKQRGDWRAYIGTPNGNVKLGRFRTKEEAVSARQAAEFAFGYHERHGGVRGKLA